MKKADFNTDFETQTLELLKLRFLESELHHCDVMLKDTQVWLSSSSLVPSFSVLMCCALPSLACTC
jgi:hypothetical protein